MMSLKIYQYKTSYDYVSRDGATVISHTTRGDVTNPTSAGVPDPLGYLVSPMQMFCIQASQIGENSLKPDALRRFWIDSIP